MGGGVGTLGGTVIGVLIIGVLNNGMNLLRIDTYWRVRSKGRCNSGCGLHGLH